MRELTCFQARLQLLKELRCEHLQDGVEQDGIGQPGHQHQRLQNSHRSHDGSAVTSQVRQQVSHLLEVASLHRGVLHLAEVGVSKEMCSFHLRRTGSASGPAGSGARAEQVSLSYLQAGGGVSVVDVDGAGGSAADRLTEPEGELGVPMASWEITQRPVTSQLTCSAAQVPGLT